MGSKSRFRPQMVEKSERRFERRKLRGNIVTF